MNRDEILQAVIKLCVRARTEEEDGIMANNLERALPHSNIIDLLFQDMRNLTIEQVVDEALKNQAEHDRQTGAL